MSVYACSDLHGQWDLFEELLTYLNPEDKVYFLGDAIDRGIFGWDICKTIINDSRFIYIMGNHEDMMLNCIGNINIENYDLDIGWSNDIQLWYWNGGEKTYNNFINDKMPIKEKIKILNKLKSLPFYAIYINKKGQKLYLTHAGFEPDTFRGFIIPKKDYLWNRSHFIADTFYGKDNEIVIHGHTPNPYLVKEINWYKRTNKYTYKPGDGAYWYADGHKCCIDCGSHYTGTTILLNLDTFEQIKIGEPINNG